MVSLIVSVLSSMIAEMFQFVVDALASVMDFDIAVFNSAFPFAAKAFPVIQGIGLGIALLLAAIQIIPFFVGSKSSKTTPFRAAVFLALSVFGIYYGNYILEGMMQIAQHPYDALNAMDATSLSEIFRNNPIELVVADLFYDQSILLYTLALILICIAFIKLLLEIVERYVVLFVLLYLSPLAASALASETTSGVTKKFVTMFFSQCLLMVLNIWCLKMVCSMFSSIAGNSNDTAMLLVMLMGYAFMRIAAKLDSYMGQLGLSAAVTGVGLGGELLAAGMGLMRQFGGSSGGHGGAGGSVGGAAGSTILGKTAGFVGQYSPIAGVGQAATNFAAGGVKSGAKTVTDAAKAAYAKQGGMADRAKAAADSVKANAGANFARGMHDAAEKTSGENRWAKAVFGGNQQASDISNKILSGAALSDADLHDLSNNPWLAKDVASTVGERLSQFAETGDASAFAKNADLAKAINDNLAAADDGMTINDPAAVAAIGIGMAGEGMTDEMRSGFNAALGNIEADNLAWSVDNKGLHGKWTTDGKEHTMEMATPAQYANMSDKEKAKYQLGLGANGNPMYYAGNVARAPSPGTKSSAAVASNIQQYAATGGAVPLTNDAVNAIKRDPAQWSSLHSSLRDSGKRVDATTPEGRAAIGAAVAGVNAGGKNDLRNEALNYLNGTGGRDGTGKAIAGETFMDGEGAHIAWRDDNGDRHVFSVIPPGSEAASKITAADLINRPDYGIASMGGQEAYVHHEGPMSAKDKAKSAYADFISDPASNTLSPGTLSAMGRGTPDAVPKALDSIPVGAQITDAGTVSELASGMTPSAEQADAFASLSDDLRNGVDGVSAYAENGHLHMERADDAGNVIESFDGYTRGGLEAADLSPGSIGSSETLGGNQMYYDAVNPATTSEMADSAINDFASSNIIPFSASSSGFDTPMGSTAQSELASNNAMFGTNALTSDSPNAISNAMGSIDGIGADGSGGTSALSDTEGMAVAQSLVDAGVTGGAAGAALSDYLNGDGGYTATGGDGTFSLTDADGNRFDFMTPKGMENGGFDSASGGFAIAADSDGAIFARATSPISGIDLDTSKTGSPVSPELASAMDHTAAASSAIDAMASGVPGASAEAPVELGSDAREQIAGNLSAAGIDSSTPAGSMIQGIANGDPGMSMTTDGVGLRISDSNGNNLDVITPSGADMAGINPTAEGYSKFSGADGNDLFMRHSSPVSGNFDSSSEIPQTAGNMSDLNNEMNQMAVHTAMGQTLSGSDAAAFGDAMKAAGFSSGEVGAVADKLSSGQSGVSVTRAANGSFDVSTGNPADGTMSFATPEAAQKFGLNPVAEGYSEIQGADGSSIFARSSSPVAAGNVRRAASDAVSTAGTISGSGGLPSHSVAGMATALNHAGTAVSASTAISAAGGAAVGAALGAAGTGAVASLGKSLASGDPATSISANADGGYTIHSGNDSAMSMITAQQAAKAGFDPVANGYTRNSSSDGHSVVYTKGSGNISNTRIPTVDTPAVAAALNNLGTGTAMSAPVSAAGSAAVGAALGAAGGSVVGGLGKSLANAEPGTSISPNVAGGYTVSDGAGNALSMVTAQQAARSGFDPAANGYTRNESPDGQSVVFTKGGGSAVGGVNLSSSNTASLADSLNSLDHPSSAPAISATGSSAIGSTLGAAGSDVVSSMGHSLSNAEPGTSITPNAAGGYTVSNGNGDAFSMVTAQQAERSGFDPVANGFVKNSSPDGNSVVFTKGSGNIPDASLSPSATTAVATALNGAAESGASAVAVGNAAVGAALGAAGSGSIASVGRSLANAESGTSITPDSMGGYTVSNSGGDAISMITGQQAARSGFDPVAGGYTRNESPDGQSVVFTRSSGGESSGAGLSAEHIGAVETALNNLDSASVPSGGSSAVSPADRVAIGSAITAAGIGGAAGRMAQNLVSGAGNTTVSPDSNGGYTITQGNDSLSMISGQQAAQAGFDPVSNGYTMHPSVSGSDPVYTKASFGGGVVPQFSGDASAMNDLAQTYNAINSNGSPATTNVDRVMGAANSLRNANLNDPVLNEAVNQYRSSGSSAVSGSMDSGRMVVQTASGGVFEAVTKDYADSHGMDLTGYQQVQDSSGGNTMAYRSSSNAMPASVAAAPVDTPVSRVAQAPAFITGAAVGATFTNPGSAPELLNGYQNAPSHVPYEQAAPLAAGSGGMPVPNPASAATASDTYAFANEARHRGYDFAPLNNMVSGYNNGGSSDGSYFGGMNRGEAYMSNGNNHVYAMTPEAFARNGYDTSNPAGSGFVRVTDANGQNPMFFSGSVVPGVSSSGLVAAAAPNYASASQMFGADPSHTQFTPQSVSAAASALNAIQGVPYSGSGSVQTGAVAFAPASVAERESSAVSPATASQPASAIGGATAVLDRSPVSSADNSAAIRSAVESIQSVGVTQGEVGAMVNSYLAGKSGVTATAFAGGVRLHDANTGRTAEVLTDSGAASSGVDTSNKKNGFVNLSGGGSTLHCRVSDSASGSGDGPSILSAPPQSDNYRRVGSFIPSYAESSSNFRSGNAAPDSYSEQLIQAQPAIPNSAMAAQIRSDPSKVEPIRSSLEQRGMYMSGANDVTYACMRNIGNLSSEQSRVIDAIGPLLSDPSCSVTSRVGGHFNEMVVDQPNVGQYRVYTMDASALSAAGITPEQAIERHGMVYVPSNNSVHPPCYIYTSDPVADHIAAFAADSVRNPIPAQCNSAIRADSSDLSYMTELIQQVGRQNTVIPISSSNASIYGSMMESLQANISRNNNSVSPAAVAPLNKMIGLSSDPESKMRGEITGRGFYCSGRVKNHNNGGFHREQAVYITQEAMAEFLHAKNASCDLRDNDSVNAIMTEYGFEHSVPVHGNKRNGANGFLLTNGRSDKGRAADLLDFIRSRG